MRSTSIINYRYIFTLFSALYLAWFAGNQILSNNSKILILLCAGFIFFFVLSMDKKFILLSLAVFFPFMFKGNLGPINLPKMIELIAPIVCFLFIIQILRNKRSFYSRKAFVFFAAITVIVLWSAISFIKHPLVGQAFAGGTEGGLRAYLTIFVGITTFLSTFWFFRYRELNVNKWLLLLLIVSVVLGYLQLIGFFEGFRIPFIGGKFNTQIDTTNLPSKLSKFSYWRIGGLSEMASLGFPILFAFLYKKKWNIFYILIFINSVSFVYLSGGRTPLVISIFVVLVYFLLINKKYFFPFITSLLLLAGILIILLPNIQLHGQIERLLAFKGGFAEQDKSRADFYRYYWEIFKENPIFGKGLGETESEIVDVRTSGESFQQKHHALNKIKFREQQIAVGGHGSYLSIVNLFGIGGVFYIIVMLYGSMYYAYRIFKRSPEFQGDAVLALFAFLFLIELSVRFITGGAGYNLMELWFLAGLIAGIRAKEGDKINEIQ